MENYQVQFRDLLKRAVSEPGTISAAYSAFHHYSLGNQLAALFQCWLRQIPAGSIFSPHYGAPRILLPDSFALSIDSLLAPFLNSRQPVLEGIHVTRGPLLRRYPKIKTNMFVIESKD